MKLAARLLVLISLAATATLTFAQTYSTQIKNVIVVIQENRTPDNLFQDQNLINAGADISQSGLCGTTIFHDQQPSRTPQTARLRQPGPLAPTLLAGQLRRQSHGRSLHRPDVLRA